MQQHRLVVGDAAQQLAYGHVAVGANERCQWLLLLLTRCAIYESKLVARLCLCRLGGISIIYIWAVDSGEARLIFMRYYSWLTLV